MRLERQKDTAYPAYLAYVGKKAVCWIEQPAGRRNGWSVHICGFTPGDARAQMLWSYRFTAAKKYAEELCKIEEASK